jgi:hypothetical protein
MDTKLSHLDEYKSLRDEITLYQHEIHRTWLWAIITAGAIYAWLASHRTDIKGFQFVVFLPVFFLIVCSLRYFAFWRRIEKIGDYIFKVEEDAFGLENGAKLPGFYHFGKPSCWSLASLRAAIIILWLFLICCSSFLSYKLLRVSAAHQDTTSDDSNPTEANTVR